jgi:hypothetical protein
LILINEGFIDHIILGRCKPITAQKQKHQDGNSTMSKSAEYWKDRAARAIAEGMLSFRRGIQLFAQKGRSEYQ